MIVCSELVDHGLDCGLDHELYRGLDYIDAIKGRESTRNWLKEHTVCTDTETDKNVVYAKADTVSHMTVAPRTNTKRDHQYR